MHTHSQCAVKHAIKNSSIPAPQGPFTAAHNVLLRLYFALLQEGSLLNILVSLHKYLPHKYLYPHNCVSLPIPC